MRSVQDAGAVLRTEGGPGRSVEGPVGRSREVLIEIDGGIEEVLSIEPAIRSLQRTASGKFNITVCAGDEALFRNHPCVREIMNRRRQFGGRRFDMHWKLGADESDKGEGPLVDRYAGRLGVELIDRRPRVYLDSYDMLRIQRFAGWRPEGWRIVIGAGSSDEAKAWDGGKWVELCEYLAGKWGATLIQVGRGGERFFGRGCNLIGKLTAREVATVIKNSNLLIGVDNDWRHLAAAVGQPAVVLMEAADAKPREGCFAVSAAGQAGAAVRDITIEAVLKGVARVHGHEHFEDFERAVCA